jgi:uncharacterized membrane protein YkoI/beta-lactamase regulating signal transducer with metallopeptidase domain
VVLLGLLIPFRPHLQLPFEPLRIPAVFEWSAAGESVQAIHRTELPSEPAAAAYALPSPKDFTPAPEARPVPIRMLLFATWLAAAIGILGFHLWSYKRFVCAVRRWSAAREDSPYAAPIPVKTCALVESPMLIGFLRPQILLPEREINADELECVLKHEITHHERGDLWVNLLVLLSLCVHWFNPLVYLAAKSVRADCEAACDETVVAGGNPETRRQYGEAIIGFIGARNTRGPLLSTYFYEGSRSMKRRLVSIMDTGRKSRILAAACTAVILSLTLLSGSVFAAATGANAYIGDAKAKSIALAHAGITEAQATFIRAHLDYDDRRVVYDVEFFSGSTEYDYEIDAVTGDIREFDRDIEYYNIPSSTRATTDAGDYIGEERAKTIALEHANVTAANATFIKAYLDHDDRLVVYDVEFYSGSTEYDYEIDAVTGMIAEFDQEIEYYAIPRSSSGSAAVPARDTGSHIGEARAKSIALGNADVTEAQTTYITARLDYDDGRIDYDVDFLVGNTEYEYEIDAVSGSIIEYDRETENRQPRNKSVPATRPVVPADPSNYIGEARAKSIALSHAGLSEAQVTRLRVKLDRDDGRAVYEVDFNNGRMEYEYEINATNGDIHEADAEYDD